MRISSNDWFGRCYRTWVWAKSCRPEARPHPVIGLTACPIIGTLAGQKPGLSMGRCRSYGRIIFGRALFFLLVAAAVVLPLRAQVVETVPTTTAQTSTASTPANEPVSGEGALIFSPAAAPLPADLTPTGNGLITGLFGPNKGP